MILHHTLRSLLRRALGALLLLGAAAPALARGEVTVTMTAGTELEAIRYALAEAVARTQGAEVSQDGPLRPELSEIVRRIELDFDPRNLDSFHIRNVSQGYVRSYEVLQTSRDDAGVTVEVRANVLAYDPANPRPGARQTVVVKGFELAPGALQLDRPAVGAEALLEDLRAALTAQVVASNKFSVLTRRNLAGLVEEQGLIAGDRVARAEKARLQQLLGADYLVAGRIERVYVHSESKTVKLTGHTTRSKTAEVVMTLTLFNVATGAIEWSAPYTESYAWDDAALERDAAFRDDAIVARTMIEEAAAALARRLVRQVFPLRVLELDAAAAGGPVFFLNAGSGVYDVGETLELIERGRELRDPDSGEVLGHRETTVALLRIVRQDEKLSQAQLVDPTPEQLGWAREVTIDPERHVCRPLIASGGR